VLNARLRAKLRIAIMLKALFLAALLALSLGGSIITTAAALAEPPDPCFHGDFGE
jgi:hypothetical protein